VASFTLLTFSPLETAPGYAERKNVLPLPGIKPRILGLSAPNLVAITTKLSLLPDVFYLIF
jgi:hypothetical protein